jgi:3-phosphoshikimate 1-carboxyvinyltransferase
MSKKSVNFNIKPSRLSGSVEIPGSKSHTIRALICGLLADGTSYIRKPLISSDTLSAKEMVLALGAEIKEEKGLWVIKGRGGKIEVPASAIDVGNSGTSLYLGMAIASLSKHVIQFTGDYQIQNRTADKLVNALSKLGVNIVSIGENKMCAPFEISGPISGGVAEISAVTSQYLSALLLVAPLSSEETVIKVPLLNEQPYIDITLAWLDLCGIEYNNNDYKEFIIPPNQQYKTFDTEISADFSSASFFLVAAALNNQVLTVNGLDYSDAQGDKKVVDCLQEMGAKVEIFADRIDLVGPIDNGASFDLNSMPDALPIMSVAGCFAEGETRLINVAQARIKETDRISVMCSELKKMGANIEELEDGLVIRKSKLSGAGNLKGYDDHRIVMALTVAALFSEGESKISGAEAAAVTFPEFAELMISLGAQISIEEN